MRIIYLLSTFLVCCFVIRGQQEFSSFTNTGHGGATTFATDYQATGINPANLGWEFKHANKKFAIGLSEFAGSLHSSALQKSELRGMLSQVLSGNFTDFTTQEKINAAKNFIDAGFAVNVDYGTLGLALMSKHLGGFAFRVNDRFQWFSKFGSQASDILFLGKTSQYFDRLLYLNSLGDTVNIANYQNMSPDSIKNVVSGIASIPKRVGEVLNGSEISMSWTREWNFSYGRRVFGDDNIAIFAGVGIKYIQGTGYVNIKSENNELTAVTSLSPSFDIDYGAAASSANSITGSGFLPKSVGSGWGFDFGVNVILKNIIKIGASLINAGSIKWTGNVYKITDDLLSTTRSEGMNNYNLPANLSGVLGENGLLKLVGQKEIETQLPGMVRLGGSILLGKFAEIGTDIILPFNKEPGNFTKTLIGFGGDLFPLPWLKLQAGFVTGGNYDFSIPLGIIYTSKLGGFEGGIASRDAYTFFTQNGPTISLATGFMRFRF